MPSSVNSVSYQAQNASAKAQMEFQERMSNTAHQREVEDLKKAGLNPVLSAGGSGASTPEGAEGYVGDENAKLFDLINTAMTQSAKTLNHAVGSLGKALKESKNNTFSLMDYVYKNPRNVSQQLWNMGMKLADPYVLDGTVSTILYSIPGTVSSGYQAAQSYLNNHTPSNITVPVVSTPASSGVVLSPYVNDKPGGAKSIYSTVQKVQDSRKNSAKTVLKAVGSGVRKVYNNLLAYNANAFNYRR